VRVGDGLCAPTGQFCEHEGWLHGMPVAAPNGGYNAPVPRALVTSCEEPTPGSFMAPGPGETAAALVSGGVRQTLLVKIVQLRRLDHHCD
jgi:hypothetical protein